MGKATWLHTCSVTRCLEWMMCLSFMPLVWRCCFMMLPKIRQLKVRLVRILGYGTAGSIFFFFVPWLAMFRLDWAVGAVLWVGAFCME